MLRTLGEKTVLLGRGWLHDRLARMCCHPACVFNVCTQERQWWIGRALDPRPDYGTPGAGMSKIRTRETSLTTNMRTQKTPLA